MERNRTAAFDERVRTFREERLRDQRAWYTAKARANSASERRLWAAILCLEMVGVLSGLAQAWLLLSVNPVGGIAAVSAGFIAWLQTKRYSDLASAYTVASDDLARLDAQFDAVVNPIEFERLVREVEAAVSREHSLWVSRRMP